MFEMPPIVLDWKAANCIQCKIPGAAMYLALVYRVKFFWLLDGYCLYCGADLGQSLANHYDSNFVVGTVRPPLAITLDNSCPNCLLPGFFLVTRGSKLVAGICSNDICGFFTLPPEVLHHYLVETPWLKCR